MNVSVKVAPVNTPISSAEKFIEIGRALSAIVPVVARSMRQMGEAAERAGQYFRASMTLTTSRRTRRQMVTALARMNRKPALIHNGRKPR